jgi:retron-type reverse transcriptase
MKTRLVNFMDRNKILSENQFGFRSGYNTEDAMACVTDFVSNKLNLGMKCIGIFIDLAKAFDTVSHRILIKKLHHIGIRGIARDWFESYLKNRTQIMKYKDICSDPIEVSYGVPQGSILGPILFLLYMNDLCCMKLTNSRIVSYADDTVLLFSGSTWKETEYVSQVGFNMISDWLDGSLLSLNSEKTNYLCFSINKSSNAKNSVTLIYHSLKCRAGMESCGCNRIGLVSSVA